MKTTIDACRCAANYKPVGNTESNASSASSSHSFALANAPVDVAFSAYWGDGEGARGCEMVIMPETIQRATTVASSLIVSVIVTQVCHEGLKYGGQKLLLLVFWLCMRMCVYY